jgi:hypothetical protein
VLRAPLSADARRPRVMDMVVTWTDGHGHRSCRHGCARRGERLDDAHDHDVGMGHAVMGARAGLVRLAASSAFLLHQFSTSH